MAGQLISSPKISPKNLNLIILILFFSGYFLYSSGFMGHPETLVLFFSLLGIKFLKKKKILVSGILFGLALSSKQSGIFILIPVFFYLLSQKNGFRQAFKLGIIAFSTLFLVILPFLIVHPADTWYGIFGVSQRLIIQGPNIWWLIDAFCRRILHLTWMNQLLIKIANPILLGLTVFLSITFFKRQKAKKDNLSLLGLISTSLVTVNVFAKWLTLHHYLPSFAFVIIWDTLRSKEGFPSFGVTYAFLLLSASVIHTPFWQLTVLAINLSALAYLCGKGQS